MNQPIPGVDSLPSWKLRLLERIQSISADHTQLLREGFPVYQPHFGSADIALQTWRRQLLVLEAHREEITVHALAVDIPTEAVHHVGETGAQGVRWGHSVHSPLTMREGEDPVRARMIEGIAGDIWQLEHMAVMRVEHQQRALDRHFPADDPRWQFDANILALWTRAAQTAQVIGLTASERAELWGRDEAGWQRLAALTVRGYDNAELHQRWQTYSWRGIEHAARLDVESLPERKPIQEPGNEPPRPHTLIERATTALNSLNGFTPQDADTGVGEAIEAVLDTDTALGWDSTATAHTDQHPPDPSVEHEI